VTPVPLLVLGVLAANDVDVFTALSTHTLQTVRISMLPFLFADRWIPAYLLPIVRTLQPSHSFLTELRTFIPLVCWKATRLFVGDATGLASDICDILATSELAE
jgi:hypothetical protein